MRLFASNTTAPVHSEHANAITGKHKVPELDDGNSIIENTHILRDLRSRGGDTERSKTTKMHRNNSSVSASSTRSAQGDSGGGGAVSNKKHKTNNLDNNYTGRSRERQVVHKQEQRLNVEEYKSRSLERYAKPPHSLAAAVAAATVTHHDLNEDDGDDEEEIYVAARRTLTPCLSTQRRRLLSPFVSMKRRSRSSTSSSGSRSHCDSREVNFNVMLPPLKLPGPMQQHIMEHQKSNGNINCLKTTKQNLGNSASSQSGDSGTGGTELEQDCSRTSAAESSQLSLSYSQLSSASSATSLSKHSKISHSPQPHTHDHHDHDHETNTHDRHLNVLHNDLHNSHRDHDVHHTDVIDNVNAVVEQHNNDDDDIEQPMQHNNAENLFRDSDRNIDQHYRDSIFSTDEFYCGNITLVDDTYSNYEPQNEAEEMFLQVVGILRDEKEVGTLDKKNIFFSSYKFNFTLKKKNDRKRFKINKLTTLSLSVLKIIKRELKKKKKKKQKLCR